VGLLARNPDLLIAWRGDRLVVEDLTASRHIDVPIGVVLALDHFRRPRSPEAVARGLPAEARQGFLRGVRRLVRLGLLLPAVVGRRRRSRLDAWKGNFASALYHSAARDLRYLESPAMADAFLLRRVAEERRPPPFKRYPDALRTPLPARGPSGIDAAPLGEVLAERRTVRAFSRKAVALHDLAAVVRGTWGRTGWLQTVLVGKVATKTSPSAGALHPIECYVFAWKVDGLKPGIYHYDVVGDELRRLRSGDFREAAVRAASGQRWVGGAGFLCVMTAVFGRTLWKYELENAYRSLWLDAGHLGQTFCLLCTARGLGPFTTAAMQDSYIERLIGLDGVQEFPVYLCGAGVRAKVRSAAAPSPSLRRDSFP
jgi:SagB-type dehydrogenase family enzyme